MATVKVRTTITVEVDAETWGQVYGVDSGDIRREVRDYVTDLVAQCAATDEGAITRVSPR